MHSFNNSSEGRTPLSLTVEVVAAGDSYRVMLQQQGVTDSGILGHWHRPVCHPTESPAVPVRGAFWGRLSLLE